MHNYQPLLKRLATISLIAFGILFILSIIFYRARVLFCDASFYLFHIINYDEVFLAGGRFGNFISQILPLLGKRMHLPLGTLMFLYGISFYLFYVIVALLLVYWLKQYKLAILMTLFYFLFVSQSFIWINEIYQGVAWMFLFFGFTIYLGQKKVPLILVLPPFTLLAFFALYTHVTVFVPTVFLWVFLIIDKKNWPFTGRATILLSGILIGIFASKFLIAVNGSLSKYDANSMKGITHVSLKDILLSLNTPVVKMFVYRCVFNYWIGIIVFVVGIFNMARNKQTVRTCWVLLSALGYMVLMGVSYGMYDKYYHLFHIECEWVCFGIIAASPWVFSISSGQKSTVIPWVLAGIFMIRLGYITASIPMFTARTEMKDNILAQMRKKGITKLALYDDERLTAKAIDGGFLPFESLLLSQVEGDKPQLTFFFVNKDNKQLINTARQRDLMFTVWGTLSGTALNKEYFQVDTTCGYQEMSYEELLK